MHFNRFDICEAYFLFQMFNTPAGDFRILNRLDRISFSARPSLLSPKDLGENAKEIYFQLVRRSQSKR